jgi:glyoxylase-like metal-dependent hydrolase (beta-lactamase superfamily II)
MAKRGPLRTAVRAGTNRISSTSWQLKDPNLKPTSLVFVGLNLIFAFAGQSPAQNSGEPLRPEWCQQLPRPEYKSLTRVDVHSDWFEVYRVRPDVYAIYEPHQFEEVISYLIVGHDRALLLDTGLGVASIKDVVVQLTGLPVVVLNSHTHFDHTGGNFEFSDILSEDIHYSRNNAQGQSNIYSRDALAPERICGKLPSGVRADSYAIRSWHVTRVVRDGEQIDLGGSKLEVIFTPGHTPDSLSLLDRKNGLLFTGDTFYKGPIYLFTPETDFAAYARSIARLAKLTPNLQLLLPSHNVPMAHPEALTRLDEAVKKIQSGEAKFVVTNGRREYSFEGFSLLLSEK